MKHNIKNEKIKQLKNNGSFCAAPWIHLHSRPDGNVQPCCIWDYGVYREDPKRFGNIDESESVTDILNNNSFKELRLKMMTGEKDRGCDRCYDREKTSIEIKDSSMRKWFNDFFIDESEWEEYINSTNDDGSIEDVKIRYLDIRFGNICNLKCRMCGHGLSSSWYEEEIKVYGFTRTPQKFIHSDCFDKIEEYLPYVKEIYFAGGEPVLYPEHLKILDRLIEIGNINCSIKYNTNLTTLKYKGRNLVDVWKNFPNVYIGASIDGMEDTVEYIRTNLVWEDFKNNFNEIKEKAPHVTITPSPTIGILNVEKFPEFDKYCIENNWLEYPNSSMNYIMTPEFMNLYFMPTEYKQHLIEVYQDYIAWILNNPDIDDAYINRPSEVLNRIEMSLDIDSQKIDNNMKSLLKRLNTYDITGNLDWKKSLPHIEDVLKKYFGVNKL